MFECNGLVGNECPDERGLPYGRRGARGEREREREREREERKDGRGRDGDDEGRAPGRGVGKRLNDIPDGDEEEEKKGPARPGPGGTPPTTSSEGFISCLLTTRLLP